MWLHRCFQTTVKANTRWCENKREIDDPDKRASLEHLLSWWLLRHWYLEKLGPRTPRELKTLVQYTRHDETAEHSIFKRNKDWHAKRLAVILFESAENHELVHRFGDGDTRVTDWLSRQELCSEWAGNRSFFINARKIPEGTYSYNFICYRLDLSMALPLRENTESEIPRELLPRPTGRNLNDRPPFFPIDWQPKTTRLTEALHHSVIPTNCIGMYDLQCLPDVAWRRKDKDDPWRPSLIYKWPLVFDLLAPRLETREAGHGEPQRWFEDYFFDVVIPMATLDVGRFVSPPQCPRNSRPGIPRNICFSGMNLTLMKTACFTGAALARTGMAKAVRARLAPASRMTQTRAANRESSSNRIASGSTISGGALIIYRRTKPGLTPGRHAESTKRR